MERRHLGLMMAIALVVAGCSASTGASGGASAQKTRVDFTLNWFPLADHAADYVALDKGYFDQQGLAVNIIQGSGSGTSVRRVDTGQADVGIADTGVVINAIRNGAHVKMIMMVLDRGTAAIYAKKSSGITKPSDLVGKKVGAPPEDAGRIVFPALATANGFDASKIQWVDLQTSAEIQALAQGQVDAILSATTQAPFFWKALGGEQNTVEMQYSDYGVDLYSNGIIASDDMIKNHPDVLKKFLEAILEGWDYTFANPQDALKIEQTYAPQIDLTDYAGNLNLVFEAMNTDRYAQHGVGWIDPSKIKANIDILQKYIPDANSNITDPNQVFTDSLLTKHTLPSDLPK